MDEIDPSKRSAQFVWQRNKYVLKKKPPLKSELKRREYITDVRRTYAQMFLNAVNSFDMNVLENMYKEYCIPDIVSLSYYDGEENPFGAKMTETTSAAAQMAHWSSLFKSAPDFLFETSFLTAYIDPVTNIRLVRCRFTMTGTRILDIKIAQKVQAEVTRKRSKNKDKFSTAGGDLMAQIHDQLAASYPIRSAAEGCWEWDLLNDNLYMDEGALLLPSSVAAHGSDAALMEIPQIDSAEGSTSGASSTAAPSKRKRGSAKGSKECMDETAEITEKISSMFTPGETLVVNGDISKTIQVDDKPLDESLKLEYKGTFTVYLNEDDKICRYEFVHTTLKEARAREAAAAAEAETAKLAAKAEAKLGSDYSGSVGSASPLSTAPPSSNESSGEFPDECK